MTTRTISRRTFNMVLAAAGVTSATAAIDLATMNNVAAAAAQNGQVNIEYWHRQSGKTADEITALSKDFNTKFAGKVQVTPIPQGSIQELNQKVRAAAAGGGLPGALMADDYDVTQYANNDIIVDIDPYIADTTNGLTAEQIAGFLPNQYNRHKLAIYDNKRMAFPQAFSAFACFYNEDMLKSAGFDGPVKTWQEFPDHARAIGKALPGKAAWILGGVGDRFMSCMRTYGVEWLKEDQKTANFDAPEVLEILTWWKDLYDEKLLQVVTDGPANHWVAGESVYFMDSSASVTGFAAAGVTFKWSGGMPPQGSKDGKLRTETYGPTNTLPKTTTEEQLAGWLWLKWLASPDALTPYVTTTSYFPSVNSAEQLKALDPFYTQYPLAKEMLENVAPNAAILAPHAALSEVRGTIVADDVNEVLLGRLSPEEGVKKLQADANDAIARAVSS